MSLIISICKCNVVLNYTNQSIYFNKKISYQNLLFFMQFFCCCCESFFRYKRRIKELDSSLRWMIDVDVQVNQWLDIKKLMGKMSEMNTKLDDITRQPMDIIEATGRSSEEDGCTKPTIDIHFRWKNQTKEHEIRFIFK